MAGLRLAQRLRKAADVHVFEKSRGFGGRMSTRRAGAYQFDHGAQYFTAHGDAFQAYLTPYIQQGTVAQWKPRIVELGAQGATPVNWRAPRYVAVPAMNSLCKAMAESLSVERGVRAARLERDAGQWHIHFESGEISSNYDWVLSTAPSVQTVELMPELVKSTADGMSGVTMLGCFSLMLGFDAPFEVPWDAAIVTDSSLAWISMDSTKASRPAAVSVLCQAENNWSEQNMETGLEQVEARLCEAFSQVTGVDARQADHIALHRWRYAKATSPARASHLLASDLRLGAAGDWCGGGRVEAAFDSADALASAVLAHISA